MKFAILAIQICFLPTTPNIEKRTCELFVSDVDHPTFPTYSSKAECDSAGHQFSKDLVDRIGRAYNFTPGQRIDFESRVSCQAIPTSNLPLIGA